jgi:diguanylate cyclase
VGEQGIGAVVSCVAMLLAAGTAMVLYARRALTVREGRRTWLLFTASCASWATGTALWMATLVAGRPITVPSVADAFHLVAVPLVLAAFLSIPAAQADRRQRVRALLDGCALACSMTFVLWALVLGDAAEQARYGSLALGVTLTYPLVDVVLASVMAVTMQVGADVRARLVGPQWVGGAAMTVANAAFAYHVLTGTFRLGTLWDLGWIGGYALLALTALRRLPARDGDPGMGPARPADVSAWMGYASLVIVLVTGLFEVLTAGSLDAVLTGIGLLLGLLVSTRQMLMINENGRLARDLERTVAELREREDLLHHRAHHDPLTELANRTLFSERLSRVLTEGPAAVLFLDLDDFKRVNDSLGHAAGDALLVAVAERLRQTVRTSDTFARLGGDEFAVLLPGIGEDAVARGQRVVEVLRAPFELAGHMVPAAVSVGVAVGARGSDPETLLRHADMAMYAAKGAGKGTVRAFEPTMEEQIRGEFELRADLGKAIDEGEPRVHHPLRTAG